MFSYGRRLTVDAGDVWNEMDCCRDIIFQFPSSKVDTVFSRMNDSANTSRLKSRLLHFDLKEKYRNLILSIHANRA